VCDTGSAVPVVLQSLWYMGHICRPVVFFLHINWGERVEHFGPELLCHVIQCHLNSGPILRNF